MSEELYRDGCSYCGWVGEPGEYADEDRCPECGREGTLLRCRDYELDYDVHSGAYRYDAFNDGVEWATAKNWFLLLLSRAVQRLMTVKGA